MTNKLFLATATAVVATASMVAPVQASGFNDVDADSEIGKILAHQDGVITLFKGSNGNFNPDANITRGQVANVIGRYILQDSVPTDQETLTEAKDFFEKNNISIKVPAAVGNDQEKEDYVAKYTALKNGLFTKADFDKNITRAQMALVLHRMIVNSDSTIGSVQGVQGIQVITDHKMGDDLKDALAFFGDNNLTAVEDFKPYQNLSRKQFAIFLDRVLFDDGLGVEPFDDKGTFKVVSKYGKEVPKEITFKELGLDGNKDPHKKTLTKDNTFQITDLSRPREFQLLGVRAEPTFSTQDSVAPTVLTERVKISTDPTDKTVSVLSITFSEAVQLAGTDLPLTTVSQNSVSNTVSAIFGKVNGDDASITIKVAKESLEGVSHIQIKSDYVKDLYGNKVDGDISLKLDLQQ